MANKKKANGPAWVVVEVCRRDPLDREVILHGPFSAHDAAVVYADSLRMPGDSGSGNIAVRLLEQPN